MPVARAHWRAGFADRLDCCREFVLYERAMLFSMNRKSLIVRSNSASLRERSPGLMRIVHHCLRDGHV
jgi:hypothetical protein